MDADTIGLIVALLVVLGALGALAAFFAPARNAALGAWSLAKWAGKKRKPVSPRAAPAGKR